MSSNPYLIGTAAVASGGTTLALTVAHATAAGDTIVVCVMGNGSTITGLSDSKGNTYTLAGSMTVNEHESCYVAQGATTALTTSDTITATYGSTSGSKDIGAVGIPAGALLSSCIDTGAVSTAGNASSNAPAVTSGTLAQAYELVIAVEGNSNAGHAPSWSGTGWTQLFSITQGSGNPYFSAAWKVAAATTPLTAATGLLNTATTWGMMVVPLKMAVTVTPASLPAGREGTYYSQDINATGGTGTYTWSVTSGSLPAGLTLDAGSGILSGTPTGSGPSTFTATATDGASHTGGESYTVAITGVGQPYVIATFSAPSGGSLTPAVPVTADIIAPGDTIYAGVLATAGSVTGVVDTAGNSYSLVQSETTNTGCQIYTFAAYGCTPFGNTANSGAGLVGATTYNNEYPGQATYWVQAAEILDGILGVGMGVAAQKVYFAAGQYPTAPSTNVQMLLDAKVKLWLCYRPPFAGLPGTTHPTDAANLEASIAAFNAAATAAGAPQPVVVLWQEPQDSSWGMSASQHQQMMVYYAPYARADGNLLAFDSSGHAGAAGVDAYYPGDAYCDIVGADYYCSTFVSVDSQTGATLLEAQAYADNAATPKPFAIPEIGSALSSSSVPTEAQFRNYISFIQNLMVTRMQQGKANSDIMWYNGTGANWNTITQSSPADYRIPLLAGLYNAVSSAAAATVTPTYTSSSSVQAVIVAGDDNVQPQTDIAVGNTATSGTTASKATGTLAQAEEHIIAFVADLAAGGAPTLGDGLTSLASVEAGTVAYLAAGGKNATTTASDTPSATLGASTTWAISVVTDPQMPVTVAPGGLASGIVGDAYSQTLSASGGSGGPYTWAVTSGSLPTGLSLATSTGVISGSPSVPGTAAFAVTATDTNGDTGTLATSILILGGGASGAPAMTLPSNLLSAADCDFEAGTPTWAADLAAGAPSVSSSVALTGTHSLAWASLAAGPTQVSTGHYPVTSGAAYIASGFMLPAGVRDCYIGIEWYDGTSTIIRTDFGDGSQSAGSQWTPLSAAVTAPDGAVTARAVVQVSNATAGEVTHLDLVFLAQSIAQVLVDWTNPPFEASSTAGSAFMDVSPWVRFDDGISMTRGRQDAISEIQPGTCTFRLQNDIGQFSRFNSVALPYALGGTVSLQLRVQVNAADELGQWWPRFGGPISEVDYEFDVTGNTSLCDITVTDVLATLNRQDVMFSWTKEQVLADDPSLHWSLDDPGTVGGAGIAAETSGSNGPPLRLLNSDSTKTATIAWDQTAGGIETLADASAAARADGSAYWVAGSNQPTTATRGLSAGVAGPFTTPAGSVYLTPVLTAQSTQNAFVGNRGYMLMAELPSPIAPSAAGSDYSIEAWFTVDPYVGIHLAADYGPYCAFGLGSSRTYHNMVTGLYLNAGTMNAECATYSVPPAFKGTNWSGATPPSATASTSTAMAADTAQLPHHAVVTITGDPAAPAVQFWLDGASAGTFTLPAGETYDTITIGGAFGGGAAWYGGISLVSVYPYALSSQQVVLHCQLGQYGMWEQTTDNCIAQLSSYASIPPFWDRVTGQGYGLSLTDYIDITGSNAISVMQQYEHAEHGLLYTDATGALNFHPRDWRMGYPAPDLYLPPGTFSADMSYELVDQSMCNEMGVTGPNTLGATATTLTQSAVTGATSTQTTTSTLVQASYVNTASQALYGTYAQNPVSSPLSLPLITWSRASAQLGLESFSYWADPNLADCAAWEANSRADPWLLPARLAVDLLTLDPVTGLGISDFYALDIDNMVAPTGTLPASIPNVPSSLEWFIEGITETIALETRTIQFFTSPAETQRAWVPGDPAYGVLGSTTRIGISAADTSAVQADGKDVAHDAGPPYWPPTFSESMNSPSGTVHPFVGANDIRGLAGNLQLMLQPPLCVVSANSEAQSVASGSLSSPQLFWDALHVDTTGGMGLIPGWPNWYCVTVPGWYEISASGQFSIPAGASGLCGQMWVVVAQQGAQALATGGGTPVTNGQYVCPVGEAVRFNDVAVSANCSPSTRMYLGLGDMVCIAAEHNQGTTLSTDKGGPGLTMSIRFTGLGRTDDRAETNSSISDGGSVTIGSHGSLHQVSFFNLHTYSYQGAKGGVPYGRRNTDLGCFQGTNGTSDAEGSQTSQIVFSASAISTALTGHTILSASLACTNQTTFYSTGGKLMLGTTTLPAGAITFHPTASNSNIDVMHQKFTQGQALSFTIPNYLVSAFVLHGATAFMLGNTKTIDLNYYGEWAGGPGQWTLTVDYV